MAENNGSQSNKGFKNKSYNVQFKLDAIKMSEEIGNRAAAGKCGVAVKRIREWRKQQDELLEKRQSVHGAKRFRLDGAGRKPLLEELEDDFLEWVLERRALGLHVSRTLIMRKALFLKNSDEKYSTYTSELEFNASRGWLEKFMRRHGLSLRRKTTQAQKDPNHLTDKLVMYVLQVRKLFRLHLYHPSNVISMDETAVWADMLSGTTIDRVGSKTVSLKTTGHEKVRVSVCLAARADGSKLKPMIVFKGAVRETKKLNDEFKGKCVIASSVNAWMNEPLTIEWIDNVLGKFSFARRFLTWDSFACHITDSVKKNLTRNNVDVVIIPGGCTKYIQPPDVSWNKPFKQHITEKYDEWMASGTQEYTVQGNVKAPQRRTIVLWILEAWKRLDSAMIASSFRSCGVCLADDGSEDETIHCFKEGQPCHSGMQRLKLMASSIDENQINPFDNFTESDVQDCAPDIARIDSDEENDIDVEI